MKKISAWAGILFAPTMVAPGLYGMNFINMPELNWRAGYPFALALIRFQVEPDHVADVPPQGLDPGGPMEDLACVRLGEVDEFVTASRQQGSHGVQGEALGLLQLDRWRKSSSSTSVR